ncbi:MAG: ATP-dependent Clp protease ATP-binding subunit [Clostridia bacterium]|nr:ATP-dependent Clp protease ATP-binding subunit [Clostridia bacterium]
MEIKLYSEYVMRRREHFTPAALNALSEAERCCMMNREHVVNTGHILYGLAVSKESAAGALLARYGVTPELAASKLDAAGGRSSEPAPAPKGGAADMLYALRYSYAAGRVLRDCYEGVMNRGTAEKKGSVGTLHILYSLVYGDTQALHMIGEMGINERELFNTAAELLNGNEIMRKRLLFQLGGLELPEELSTPENEALIKELRERQEAARQEAQGEGQPDQLQQGARTSGSALAAFGRDMVAQAAEGVFLPVIGREKEMERMIHILFRKTKNNPCLVGEAGVGKTAIVEGLAARIAAGNVPGYVRGLRIIRLDMTAVVAGTRYRGDFEERMKQIIDEATADPGVVLFIDEIHTIVGGGSVEGGMDASALLKPALSRGLMRVIGATTQQEYRKYFERDAALSRRFQPVSVGEPDEAETAEILKGIAPAYEAYHGVKYDAGALNAAVRLAKRYITDRFLPDKAIDVIDEAAARVRTGGLERYFERTDGIDAASGADNADALSELARGKYKEKIELIKKGKFELAGKAGLEEKRLRDRQKAAERAENGAAAETGTDVPAEVRRVTVDDIEKVVSRWSGVPVEKLGKTDSQRLLELEKALHRRVVGQDEAVNTVSKAVRRGRAGMKDPKRPIGSFLFLGPTGVGKTELARALAEELFGSETALIRLDMSEYMEAHSVSKMVGSPPGYIGHDDGGQLTERVRMQPYSVILFDEIEKAHPDVYNILLQVLEDGILTDSKGRTADFKNTVIIMTSNIGARDITDRRHLGFSDDTEENKYEQIADAVRSELKKAFKPEFLNRVDETVIFRPLTPEQIREIAELQLALIEKRSLEAGIRTEFAPEVAEWLAARGYDPRFGARPLKRLIRKEIEDTLAEEMLRVLADAKDGGSDNEDAAGGSGAALKIRIIVEDGRIAAKRGQ